MIYTVILNPVGDSMVAGFIYGISKGKKLEEASKYGIASGSEQPFHRDL
ncbi:MAG: PfkB family carbohydrate kinase [Fusobacteriaceae bacterium]